MTTTIDNITWYKDPKTETGDELCIVHSYMVGLATALNHISPDFDPVWLMGSSGFAFRIWINETMCPSAMSIFNWSDILPEAVEQAGYQCDYVSRMWDEEGVEKERREQAHTAIVAAINRGVPSIVWDIHDVEWGLIVGYDDGKKKDQAIAYDGKQAALPQKKLGKNGIDILSVAVPGSPNGRSRQEIVRRSLEVAVAHADQQEWTDRPKYQNGLQAFDLWALLFERWAMLVEAGKGGKIGLDIISFAEYYARHYYSARCYARDYLKTIADGNKLLGDASISYGTVAGHLKPVWEYFQN